MIEKLKVPKNDPKTKANKDNFSGTFGDTRFVSNEVEVIEQKIEEPNLGGIRCFLCFYEFQYGCPSFWLV